MTATDQKTVSITGSASFSVGQLTAGMTGATTGAPGQPLTFTLTAAEGGQPTSTVFTYQVDSLGNGKAIQSTTGRSGLSVSHIGPSIGRFTPRVTVVDHAGSVSASVSALPVTIQAVALEHDPADGGKTALVVGGTPGERTRSQSSRPT